MDKNKFEFLFWKFLDNLINFFGIKRVPILARIISGLFFYFIPIRKEMVINNLTKAFPDKSTGEIKKLARKNYYCITVTFMELLILSRASKDEIIGMVEEGNLDIAKKRIYENRGTIFLTGHFGNWELAALYAGLAIDISLYVLVKKQRNPYVADWMTKLRERFENKEITLGVSVKDLYKTLAGGGTIAIVGDQRGPKDGVMVNYFNQPTMTFQGFAVLALKRKVPVFVSFFIRNSVGKYRIKITEMSFDNLPENNSEAIQELNQRYMTILEETVRETPEQWLWMHNIWKYQ